MWISDLSPYSDAATIVAVGWLARGHEYPLGVAEPEVYAKLQSLLTDPWQPTAAAGLHRCDLCLYAAEKAGSRNVFVPGKSIVYVAPELITHYMNVHGYLPPREFCEAVINCPPMGSAEYRRALLSAGGSGFLASAGATLGCVEGAEQQRGADAQRDARGSR